MSPLVLDLKHNRFVICLFIDQEALEPNTEKPKLVTLSKFVFLLILSPIFPELKLIFNILRNLACVADVN